LRGALGQILQYRHGFWIVESAQQLEDRLGQVRTERLFQPRRFKKGRQATGRDPITGVRLSLTVRLWTLELPPPPLATLRVQKPLTALYRKH
jgi:hypothetical protein